MFDRIKYALLNFWDENLELCLVIGTLFAVVVIANLLL